MLNYKYTKMDTTAPFIYTINDVFSQPQITWFGLDFSHARLIGSQGFTDPKEVVNRYFNSWNRLFQSEPQKFNIHRFLRKSQVKYDLSVVEKRNVIADPYSIVIDDDYSFEVETAQKIVSEFDLSHHSSGIGAVFIVESLNKFRLTATIHVTFFDISSKNILLISKLVGRVKGIGFRNFWMGGIFDILKQLNSIWPSWQKKYR